MKSVLILSTITFVLIFGGVAVLTLQLDKASGGTNGGPELSADDYAASERVLHDAEVERDRIQQDRERLSGLGQSYAVQAQVLEAAQKQLREIVSQLDARQTSYDAESEETLAKLAKMYEAMKAPKAAPILASLDIDITIDILRRVKDRQAAAILSAMDPGLAAQISTRLSQGVK